MLDNAAPPHVTGLFTVDALLSGQVDVLTNTIQHLILPAFTLGYFSTAVISRMMRSSTGICPPAHAIRD